MSLKKRIIGSIVAKRGLAVQSFGFRRYLPLGNPSLLAENLDRWGADEILLQCIDQSSNGLGPDLETLGAVAARVSTPIAYGGGIRCTEDALNAIHAGADRLVIDSLFHTNPEQIAKIAEVVGSQAIILSLPLSVEDSNLTHFNYLNAENKRFQSSDFQRIADSAISEILAIDFGNEGFARSFDERILDMLMDCSPVIAFGGVSHEEQFKRILSRPNVSAVASGNFLNYKEHSIQAFKSRLSQALVRPPLFSRANHELQN